MIKKENYTRHILCTMIYLTAFYLLLCVVFNPLCIMCEKWHLLAEIDIQYYVHGNAAEKKLYWTKNWKIIIN